MGRIKGWKKGKRNRYYGSLYWKNTVSGNTISIKKAPKGQWVVFTPKTLRYSKTKESAMKYAVNWMRGHPNG